MYSLFFFFKQKTAYEMRISDGVQTCALPISCCCSTAAAHDRPQILVISSADSMLPAGRILSDEVRQGLEGGLGHEVDIFVESLDALRFPEPIFGDMVAALVEAKYHGKRFDLVYALGPHAYHFVRSDERRVGKECVSRC